ncbi:hypothetical protein IAD21_04754 [Abditibacteriota bacterium]|nr:hypothetical protein IAD21_04754 [Abditibacteriota bacterium]
MKRAFLFLLLAAAPVCAQQTTPAPTTPSSDMTVATPVVATPMSTPSFLASRGVVSSDDLVKELNAQLTPEQRAQLDQALAKRNAALTRANDELSATLRDLLRETDAGLAKRVDENAEAKRMDRLRRLQPARYQELMNRKNKEKKTEGQDTATK